MKVCNKKKSMCFVLVLALILTLSVPVFGAEQQSDGLKRAILTAKSVITIPESYTEVYYSSYEDENGAGGRVTVWNLEWAKPDGSAAISASADERGNLISMYSYTDEEQSGLSKVTRESAEKMADAFIQKALPGLKDNMKRTDEAQAAFGDTIPFSYQLEVNGIPAPFASAQVGVNKYTGKVESYSSLSAGRLSTLSIEDFPQADPKLSLEEAQAVYLEKLAPKLKYFTHYDYKDKKMNVFAGYELEKDGQKAVDAATGEIVSISPEYVLYRENMMGKAAMTEDASGGSDEGALSVEEQEAVDQAGNLIDRERAASILQSAFSLGREKVLSGSLVTNRIDKNQYYWNLSFENGQGSVDAKTGEVLSYYSWDDRTAGRARISAAEAIRRADELAARLSPQKRRSAVLSNEEELYEQYENNKNQEYPEEYRVIFSRMENEIPVSDNGITVGLDARTGRITYYRNTWYSSVTFPSITGAMDPAAAFRIFNEKGEMRLEYIETMEAGDNGSGNSKIVLAYHFKNDMYLSSYVIDPIKGEPLNYAGEPYRESELPNYSDISGHWAESTIRKLLDNGYYIAGEQFQPEKQITQEEFLRYLYQENSQSQSDFYERLIAQKIVTKEEMAPEAAVMRQEAAKFIVRYLGFEKLAVKSDIFKDVFTDKVSDRYKGYAAICSAMGIMKGDAKGRFNDYVSMTRAEAACAIYQLAELQ